MSIDDPGAANLRLGGRLCVLGAIALLVVGQAYGASLTALPVALLTAGVGLIAIGFIERIRYRRMSPEQQEAHRRREFERTLLRAVLLVANADGELRRDEVATIERVYKAMTGTAISADAIERRAREVGRSRWNRQKYIADLGRRLDLDKRLAIFRACWAVMCSDGDQAESERRVLSDVERALELPPQGGSSGGYAYEDLLSDLGLEPQDVDSSISSRAISW